VKTYIPVKIEVMTKIFQCVLTYPVVKAGLEHCPSATCLIVRSEDEYTALDILMKMMVIDKDGYFKSRLFLRLDNSLETNSCAHMIQIRRHIYELD
jgi:hypothetical protein